jgi:hypothetical protein
MFGGFRHRLLFETKFAAKNTASTKKAASTKGKSQQSYFRGTFLFLAAFEPDT